MKTDDLIAQLAADAAPVRPGAPMRKIGPAAVAGALASLALVVFWLGLLPINQGLMLPQWWVKFGYGAALGLTGLALTVRMSRPAHAPLAPFAAAGAAVAGLMALAGVINLTGAEDMNTVWLGRTWRACPPMIVILSVPIYAATVLALRRLAPVRPALTGAAAGLFAGGAGAALYALHCPELTPAFVATWYSLGVAASAALGALAGSRLLRW